MSDNESDIAPVPAVVEKWYKKLPRPKALAVFTIFIFAVWTVFQALEYISSGTYTAPEGLDPLLLMAGGALFTRKAVVEGKSEGGDKDE